MSARRTLRRISPLGMRVLVKIQPADSRTDTGLYLPQGSNVQQSESLVAEVLEVASAHDSDTNEETNVSGIPLGAIVLIAKHAGVRVPWDDSLRLVATKEVLAVIDEIEIV